MIKTGAQVFFTIGKGITGRFKMGDQLNGVSMRDCMLNLETGAESWERFHFFSFMIFSSHFLDHNYEVQRDLLDLVFSISNWHLRQKAITVFWQKELGIV